MEKRSLSANRSHLDHIRYVLHVPENHEKDYLSVMQKYSEEWWRSGNPFKIAKYQMSESLLLVPFVELQNALEIVLGRPVASFEISIDNQKLRAEVETATA